MNLFKVLARGKAGTTIREVQATAFLECLLDPYTDHGLGDQFLRIFLEEVSRQCDCFSESELFWYRDREEKKLRKMGRYSNFEYKFSLEEHSGHLENGKSGRIDLRILIWGDQHQKHSEANPDLTLYIENKVQDQSAQNIEQLTSYYSKLKTNGGTGNKILVYLVPSVTGINARKHFEELERFVSKDEDSAGLTEIAILGWKKSEREVEYQSKSVAEMLANILELENQAVIDPISVEDRYILKSFINFIATDFKSQNEEKEAKVGISGYEVDRLAVESNGITDAVDELFKRLKNEEALNQEVRDLIQPRFWIPSTASPALSIDYNKDMRLIFYFSDKQVGHCTLSLRAREKSQDGADRFRVALQDLMQEWRFNKKNDTDVYTYIDDKFSGQINFLSENGYMQLVRNLVGMLQVLADNKL